MAKYSVRRAVAIVAALCVWVAATLQALQIWGMTGGVGSVPLQARGLNITSPTAFLLLDEAQLKDYWSWKRGQLQVDVGINLFTTAGLLGLTWSVLVLSPIFGRYKDPFAVNLIGGDADLPHLMVGMFFIGAICPAYSLAQTLGLTQAADTFSQQDGLPAAGLQAMHMAYQIFRGEGMYMFSTQFVFIPIGLCILAHLSFRTGEMSQNHGVMGIVTAFFGFITFFLELGVYNLNDAIGSAVGAAFGVSLLFYGIVLLPLWTIWLGIELRRIKSDRASPPLPKRGANHPHGDTTATGATVANASVPLVEGATAVSIAGTDVAIDHVSSASPAKGAALLIGMQPQHGVTTPVATSVTVPIPSPVSNVPVVTMIEPSVTPVVVPALAPPPQSRHVVAAPSQAAISTPPFTSIAAASPPSPVATSTGVSGQIMPSINHGSSHIDFLSGGISSSFVAVDPPQSSSSPPVVTSSSESFDMLARPAVPLSSTATVSVTPAVAANPFGSATDVTCGNCEKEVATIHCSQCDGDMCDACNTSVHATGLLKKHKRTPLANTSSSSGVDALQ